MIWSSKNNAKIDGWNSQNSVMSKFQTGTGIPPNSKMPPGLGKTSVQKSQIQNVQTHPKNWSMHLCCGIAVECGVYGWGYTCDGYGPGMPRLSRLACALTVGCQSIWCWPLTSPVPQELGTATRGALDKFSAGGLLAHLWPSVCFKHCGCQADLINHLICWAICSMLFLTWYILIHLDTNFICQSCCRNSEEQGYFWDFLYISWHTTMMHWTCLNPTPIQYQPYKNLNNEVRILYFWGFLRRFAR